MMKLNIRIPNKQSEKGQSKFSYSNVSEPKLYEHYSYVESVTQNIICHCGIVGNTLI